MNATKRALVLSNIGLGCLVALACSWIVFKDPLLSVWLDHRLRELDESERWKRARSYEDESPVAARVAEDWYLEVLDGSGTGVGPLVTVDDHEAAEVPRSIRFYEGEEDALVAAERLVALRSWRAAPALLKRLVAFAESAPGPRPVFVTRNAVSRSTTRRVTMTRRTPTVRSSDCHFSVYALSKLGAAAIPTLRGALSHPDAIVRREALRALSLMGDAARAVEAQVLPLLSDRDHRIQGAALDLLLSWDPAAPRAVTRLLSRFHAEPADSQAFVGLTRIARSNCALVGWLVRRLADVDESLELRTRSARILCLLGHRAGVAMEDLSRVFVRTSEDSEQGLLLGDVLTCLGREEPFSLAELRELSVFSGVSPGVLFSALHAADREVIIPSRRSVTSTVRSRIGSLPARGTRLTRSFTNGVSRRTTTTSSLAITRSSPARSASRLGSGPDGLDHLEEIRSLLRDSSPSRH